jgi:hypothetical protein
LVVETRAELRTSGVRVVAVSNPYGTNTIQDARQEAIHDARTQTGSMEIAFNTFRGIGWNAMTRDPQTGWCHKTAKKAQTEATLKKPDSEEMTKPKPVAASDILESYHNLEKALQTQDNSTKRKMLRHFVR